MIYELIPILIFLGLWLIAGIALITDASVRAFRSIQVSLRDRRRQPCSIC